jgi:hypothetical protein
VEEITYKKLCGKLGDSKTLKKEMGGLGDGENNNHLQLNQWQRRHRPTVNVAPQAL